MQAALDSLTIAKLDFPNNEMYKIKINIQGGSKPLRPPSSILRSNDFIEYFIPN